MMFKPVARVLTRLEGENDGLFIGALMSPARGLLMSNSIYELRECQLSGNIVLKYIGPSAVGSSLIPYNQQARPCGPLWIQGVESVLNYGPSIFLTEQELNNIHEL